MIAEKLAEKNAKAKNFKLGFDDKLVQLQAIKRQALTESLRKDQRQSALSKRRKGLAAGSDQKAASEPFSPDMVAPLVDKLRATQAASSERAALLRQLRDILAGQADPPLAAFVKAGVVPVLVQELAQPNAECQHLSAWCLTNLATGSHDDARAVLEAAPLLIALLGSPTASLQEQCTWALGNLAEDPDLRKTLVKNGVLLPVVQLMRSSNRAVVRVAAWALSNLLKGAKQSAGSVAEVFKAGIGELVVKRLLDEDDSVATECAWLLQYLTLEDAAIEALIKIGLIPPLLSLLQRRTIKRAATAESKSAPATAADALPDHALLVPLVRAIGNMAAGKAEFVDALLAGEQRTVVLAAFHYCLQHKHRAVRKEAAWALSNLISHRPEYVDLVVATNFVPLLSSLLNSGSFDIAREAAFVLFNISSVDRHLPLLVKSGVLPGFLKLLKVVDTECVQMALRFVEHVLVGLPDKAGVRLVQEADGIEALESVSIEAGQLYDFAHGLVDRFYGDEYEGEAVGEGPASFSLSAEELKGMAPDNPWLQRAKMSGLALPSTVLVQTPASASASHAPSSAAASDSSAMKLDSDD